MNRNDISIKLLGLCTMIILLSCNVEIPRNLTLEIESDAEQKKIDIQSSDIKPVRIRDDGKLYTVEITLNEKNHKILEEITRANLGKKMVLKSNAEVLYEGTILAPLQGGYLGLICSSKDEAEAITKKMGRRAVYYSTKPTVKDLQDAKAYTEPAKDPWLQRAMDADLDGEYEKAEEYARKAIEVTPGNPMPHNILGAIYHRQGKNDLALQEVLAGERLSSKEDLQRFPGTYLGIGDIFAELKEYDKAIEYYRKVLSSHQGNLLAHEGLAKVYENMHRTDIAIEQYRILEKSESKYFQKQGVEGIKRLKGSPSEK